MSLPDDLKTNLLRRLAEEAGISEESSNSIIEDINTGTPVKWNTLLNKELEQEGGQPNEAQD